MVRQFFAQRRNLFSGHWTRLIPPLAPFISKHVRNFLVGQRFVPGLHHRAAELLTFYRDRSLQTFENDHGRSLRSASSKFGSGQWRILAGNTKPVRLMTGLTVRRENLFAAIAR